MIRWTGIEGRSRGLICGPATLITPTPAACRLWAPRHGDEFYADAPVPFEGWQPTRMHWKVVVAAREGGEILWQRPFFDYAEAFACYLRALGWRDWRGFYLPGEHIDGELHIRIATVATYNATNSTNADWGTGNKVPAGVTTTDYLCIAGGASGGSNVGGGGGAGGYRTATGFAVTPGTQVTITVGAGGTAQAVSNTAGNNGGNSVFDSVTSTGGGGGGAINTNGPSAGGSGGGASQGGSASTTGGAASPAGQGNAGGNGTATDQPGGGGGAGAVGGTGNGSHTGNGGDGLSSSISGSAVTRAGGGGGGGYSGGSTTVAGTGGAGGGGAGGTGDSNAGLGAGTANTGSGGGGSTVTATSGAGGLGVIILSFTPRLAPAIYQRRTRFFTRSF